jgi:iron complex transport system substrate-binding protein
VGLEALRAIEPNLVITQDLCHVCAASPDDLAAALAGLPRQPRVLSLTPHNLAEVWNDIRAVGEATGCAAEARALVAELERRVAAVEQAVAGAAERPRVVCMEWLDPAYAAGHWVPEMVARAGGREVLGRAGEPSTRVRWEEILSLQPEVILVMPCGYHLEQGVEEFARTALPAGWKDLPAVREGRVYAVDASSYFSRPGPRLATGVEILAHVLHPERAPVAAPAGSFCPVFENVS